MEFKSVAYRYLSIMKAYLFFLHFIGVVPAALPVLQPIAHKYHLIKTQMTWTAAQAYCRETYEDLATVEHEQDWVRLNAEVEREGVTDVAWVGLYNDVLSWRWSYNDIPLENTFEQWNRLKGQPDNAGGDQSCGLTGTGGHWWDYPCTSLYTFICYNANNDHANRFVGVPSKLTWHEAQAYCREFHTDLVTATTENDNNAMENIAKGQGVSWIGLYRDTWKWSDGTSTSNLQWLSGQPDNVNTNENCATLDEGMFTDIQCDQLFNFICHTSHQIKKRQGMRLQVKSDQTIFDSHVQSAILELIKQKLKDKIELEKTTLTWRVQSDGRIFHKKKKEH